MSGFEPNDEQEELIEDIEGIYVADAGPGTGKTFTISLRYSHLLQKGVDPEDILLVTFTENAAENMKERIINTSDHEKSELRDAPICTFHSYCNRLLRRYGHEAPEMIGINDRLTHSTRVIENEILERREFERFISDFMDRHPEYRDLYRVVYSKTELLDLIKSLGAKGIFPCREGWFRNSERYLDGNFERFKKLFEEMNRKREGAYGPKQSRLRKKLNGYKNKCFLPKAPTQREVRGENKKVPEKYAETCFNEDREELKSFVHDVYFEYVEYALSRNYMNFTFMIMFAFVLLCEDHPLREKVSFEYMMIDEFQDTNEIQFKLALLLSKSGNICVVGDWKQSIFSFQYASVKNITEFERRLKEFTEDLNTDHRRVSFKPEVEDEVSLKENFRSTQEIIDFSEKALSVEATKSEVLDKEEIISSITELKAVENEGPGNIDFYVGEDEKDVILSKITDIVSNENFILKDEGEPRRIKYGDIAVLVRTRKFGLELLNRAEKEGVPVAYEGGIELFRREPALILLAWLRVVQDFDSKRGWSVILDKGDYTLNEIEKMFDEDRFPQDMLAFRDSLKEEDTVGSLAKKVFDKYSMKDAFTDRIIEVIQSTYDNTYMNRENIIDFIVENIEAGQTYEVDSTTENDVFKIQTIHSSKGLEYPVVFLADMGAGRGGFGGAIEYDEPIGLRHNRIFSEDKYPYVYDNWKKYLLSKCLSGDYDEERRLLYVAMSRAENYLFLVDEEGSESTFFENLAERVEFVEKNIEPTMPESEERKELKIQIPEEKAPVKYSAHSLVGGEPVSEEGLGLEYGAKVHSFAERYVRGENIRPRNRDEENVKEFIDGLEGELLPEKVCLLPVEGVERKSLFKGVIDLVNVDDDTVKVVDYKTDRDRSMENHYCKQVSVYKHALDGAFPDKEVKAVLFYTEKGEEVPVKTVPLKELVEIAEGQK